eukprot:c19086_g1_i1 orf=2981-6031(+)
MPFDTPPGQVLSSVPPSSGKRRSSKIGGCAGVLFQIFHGKRLFPRKSLPAERPKHDSINHTDDKLPIAKLLLIADENRGGSLKDADEELEEDNVPKDEPCEEKPSKRAPSVVARLMGLETMPSPEPASGERKQSELHKKDMDCQFSPDVPQEKHTSVEISQIASETFQPYDSLHRARTKESKSSLPEKSASQQKASTLWKDKAKGDVAKSKVLSKSSSLPPHHLDSTFPSNVSMTKKGDPINKSSMRTQTTTHLLEATAKMLQTSAHPNPQTRNQRLQSSLSRSKFASHNVARNGKGQSGREQVFADPRGQAIQQLTASAAQASSSRRDETKNQIGSRNTSNEMVNRRQGASSVASIPESRKPQVSYVGPPQVLGGGKGSLHEAAPVKRKHSNQQTFAQPRANLLEKAKSDWRRQEETSRRLSQPTSYNSIKNQRSKPFGATNLRHPSPPKSVQDSSGGPCSSQASNCTPSSQPTISCVGSNDVPTRRLSSSSVKGFSAQPEDGNKCVEATLRSQSLYNKAEGLPCRNLSVVQNSSISVTSQFGEADNSSYSQYSHDGSTSSAIYTESHQRSSMESSISSDPSLSEFTTSSEECSSFLAGAGTVGHGREEAKWESDHCNLNEAKRALDMLLPEDSSQSNCDSLPVDLGDTASSHTQSDADAKRHDATVTYSGKNTAAILQELLTALSSSSLHTQSDEKFKKPKVECTESCSSDFDFREVENPQILPGGYSLYAQGLSCTESPFQDSASCSSLDGSEISQGSKQCDTNNFLESMDCTTIAETEAEDEVSARMTDTTRTEVEHRVSAKHTDYVDCEALMSTISKLHHIDPEVIGLNVRATKHHKEDKYQVADACRDGLSGCLIDSVLFDKLEEQVQQLDWGLSSSATLTAEDDADSIYRSDMESSFRSGYEEVAAQNKKLVTDCINEAFKNLSGQLYGFSLSLSGQSSATHVLSRVYKQIDEWRGMAMSMNLDDMVEKEMNLTTQRWRNIGTEAEEVAELVESTILSGLMEEVLLELI